MDDKARQAIATTGLHGAAKTLRLKDGIEGFTPAQKGAYTKEFNSNFGDLLNSNSLDDLNKSVRSYVQTLNRSVLPAGIRPLPLL